MVCQCCGKPRQNLSPQKSALIKGNTFIACETCREARYEPRHFIIMMGRSFGPASVREYITKRLYTGEEITAKELIP